jgi:hypothetical protein
VIRFVLSGLTSEARRLASSASFDRLLVGQSKEATEMRKIYVSDSGNDKDDGLTEKTPIRSWQRFIQLCEGNGEIIIMVDANTGKMRLIAEIDKKARIAQGEVLRRSLNCVVGGH